ncbi:MAG: HEAT repeat domain-containing protein, partial [Nocardioides sp.]
ELRYLAGRSFDAGDRALDPDAWPDHWVRTWGARGLLHVWDDVATDAVIAGLDDGHWRPAEMCLKVATRHEVGGAGDGAARLATHELPRVRAQAMRALGAVGDTEHVAALEGRLDDEYEEVRRQAARALERLEERLDLAARP